MSVEAPIAVRGGRWFWSAWAAAFLGFPLGGLAATALVGPVDTIAGAALAGAGCRRLGRTISLTVRQLDSWPMLQDRR